MLERLLANRALRAGGGAVPSPPTSSAAKLHPAFSPHFSSSQSPPSRLTSHPWVARPANGFHQQGSAARPAASAGTSSACGCTLGCHRSPASLALVKKSSRRIERGFPLTQPPWQLRFPLATAKAPSGIPEA